MSNQESVYGVSNRFSSQKFLQPEDQVLVDRIWRNHISLDINPSPSTLHTIEVRNKVMSMLQAPVNSHEKIKKRLSAIKDSIGSVSLDQRDQSKIMNISRNHFLKQQRKQFCPNQVLALKNKLHGIVPTSLLIDIGFLFADHVKNQTPLGEFIDIHIFSCLDTSCLDPEARQYATHIIQDYYKFMIQYFSTHATTES